VRWGPKPGEESNAKENDNNDDCVIGANMTEVNTSDSSPNYGIARELMWFVPVLPQRKSVDDDNGNDDNSNVDDLMMPNSPTSIAGSGEKQKSEYPEAIPAQNAAAVEESPLIIGAAADEKNQCSSPTPPPSLSSSSSAPTPLARESMLVSARLLFGVCDGLWRMRRSVLDPCLDRPSAAALSRLGTVVRSAESIAIAQAARASRGRSLLDPSKWKQRQHDGEGGWEMVTPETAGGGGNQGGVGSGSFDSGSEDGNGVNSNNYWRDYT